MPADALALLTPDEAAAALGCEISTVEDKLRAGKLPGVKLGKSWRLPVDALRQHLAAQAMKNLERAGAAPPAPAAIIKAAAAQQRRAPPALPSLG